MDARADTPKEYCWNVSEMYESFTSWEKDFLDCKGEDEKLHWPYLLDFKGKLEDPEILKDALDTIFELERKLARVYTYAHLRYDEDLGNTESKNAFLKATSLLHQFSLETSWIQPELLQIAEDKYQELLQDENLSKYKVHLEQLGKLRPHVLSEREEELMALGGNALHGPGRIFSAFENADLTFPNVKDSQGKEHPLTTGSYISHIRSEDRILRKNAYETLFSSFKKYENTLCEILSSQVQSHLFFAKAKKFSSCLEAALYPNQIDTSVYHNLIEGVREALPALHKYVKLKKQALGVKELYPYDLYVPLFNEKLFSFSYDEAKELVISSVTPLGEEYQAILQKGLAKNSWVDVFENARKRSGAYSSGCYDSMPYILMNYQNNLTGLLTLAHEAGHSMHSFLSNKNQPYHYASYPIFVAEVASTFHEQLMLKTLLDMYQEPTQKAALLLHALEGIRGTIFRQTLFAEFELYIHECAEKQIPLTPDLLRQKFIELNSDYFGSELTLDEYIGNEWSRIPHFYYNFYVYQYATGLSAALALFNKLNSDQSFVEHYLGFLSSGGSDYPLNLLKKAGVDLTQKGVVGGALTYFNDMVDELEELLTQLPLNK